MFYKHSLYNLNSCVHSLLDFSNPYYRMILPHDLLMKPAIWDNRADCLIGTGEVFMHSSAGPLAPIRKFNLLSLKAHRNGPAELQCQMCQVQRTVLN